MQPQVKKTLIYAALAGAGYLFLKSEAAAAVEAVGEAVDPTSGKNIFYRGVNAVGEAVTGTKEFSLGAWIYETTHPNAVNAQNLIKGGA